MFEISIIVVLLLSLFVCINPTEFFIGSRSGYFRQASDICLDDGGIVATIVNENDYNKAKEIVIDGGFRCWIGLNRWDNNVNWRYVDGTSVKGTYGFDINGNANVGNGPWGNNEPNDIHNDEFCVEFIQFPNGLWQWNDENCGIRLPLCMKIETEPIKQLS